MPNISDKTTYRGTQIHTDKQQSTVYLEYIYYSYVSIYYIKYIECTSALELIYSRYDTIQYNGKSVATDKETDFPSLAFTICTPHNTSIERDRENAHIQFILV